MRVRLFLLLLAGALALTGNPESSAVVSDDVSAPSAVGLFDPSTGRWHLRHLDGQVSTFYYGIPGDTPLMGDWDCDGIDTVAMYRESTGFVYLRNSNTQGIADQDFYFGIPGDIPLAGDWNGNGCDTFSIYRPSQGRVFISNQLGTRPADFDFYFGVPGDRPFAGDFDGDDVSTVGLFRESSGLAYFRNTLDTGAADYDFYYGIPSDRILAGDWDADGDDTVGIFRPTDNRFYLSNENELRVADLEMSFGGPSWLPVSGLIEDRIWLSTAADTSATPMISNGGFEQGKTGWDREGRIVTDAHSGSNAWLLEDTSPTGASSTYTFQLPAAGEGTYLLDAWVKSATGTPGWALFVISQHDHAQKQLPNENWTFPIYVDEEWANVRRIVGPLDPAARFVRVGFLPAVWLEPEPGELLGEIVVDDVQFWPYDGANLIENGSFETNIDTWATDGAGTLSHESDPSFAFDSVGALRITDDSTDAAVRAGHSDVIPVLPSEPYLLSGWVKAQSPDQTVVISVSQRDIDGRALQGENIDVAVTAQANGWTAIRRVIDDLHPETRYVRITLWPRPWDVSGDATGTAWFDRVVLRPYGANLIDDGGFEVDDGWTSAGRTTEHHHGFQALKLTDAGHDVHGLGLVPVISDEPYLLAGWIKAETAGGDAQITIVQFDGMRRILQGRNIDVDFEGVATDWQPFERLIRDQLDSAAHFVQVRIGGAAGPMWLDNVQLHHQRPVEGAWLPTDGPVDVWWSPPFQKVGPAHTLAPSAVELPAVDISAAGGEYESFQIVLVAPTVGAVDGVDATRLTASSGASLPWSALEVRQVDYITIERPTPAPTEGRPFPPPGDGNPMWYPTRGLSGVEFPDPLPPFTPGLTLEGGRQQPLWFTVWVPNGQAPGEYRGEIEITTTFGAPITIPLVVHVWDFDLPSSPTLRTSYGLKWGQVYDKHHVGSASTEARSVFNLYLENLSAHRIDTYNPIGESWYQTPTATGPSGNRTFTYDFREFDASAEYAIAVLGLDSFRLWIPFVPGGGEVPWRPNPLLERVSHLDDHFLLEIWEGVDTNDIVAFSWIDTQTSGYPSQIAWGDDYRPGSEITWTLPPEYEARYPDAKARKAAIDDLTQQLNAQKVNALKTYMDDHRTDLLSTMAPLGQYLAANSLLDEAYLYQFDEAKPASAPLVAAVHALVGDGMPGLTRILTLDRPFLPAAQGGGDDALRDQVDRWALNTGWYGEAFAEERQTAGDDVWWYTATGPRAPFANNFIDYPAIDLRARFWEGVKLGIDGDLYWETVYWTEDGCADPWIDPATYRNPTVCGENARFYGNGDGRLLYPPKGWNETSAALVEGPVPSMRWELLREAMEDVDYFALLRQRALVLQGLGSHPSLAAEGLALAAVPADVVSSLSEYSQSLDAFATHRRLMAEKLVEVNAAIGAAG